MTHARSFSVSLGLSIAVAIAGCGGGTRASNDAAGGGDSGNPGVDAASPGVDAASPGVDAASPGNDAASPGVDAASDVDAATTGSGACTNSADSAVLAAGGVDAVVSMCGNDNLGREPATQNCIRSMSGLTTACADCFDGSVRCGVMHCPFACAGGNTPMCMTCLETNCNPAFRTCSGLGP